jgi:hypothetical protein
MIWNSTSDRGGGRWCGTIDKDGKDRSVGAGVAVDERAMEEAVYVIGKEASARRREGWLRIGGVAAEDAEKKVVCVCVNHADARNHACQLESDGSGCPSGEGRVRTLPSIAC